MFLFIFRLFNYIDNLNILRANFLVSFVWIRVAYFDEFLKNSKTHIKYKMPEYSASFVLTFLKQPA